MSRRQIFRLLFHFSRELIKFPEISMFTKFPEISRFSRLVDTMLYSCIGTIGIFIKKKICQEKNLVGFMLKCHWGHTCSDGKTIQTGVLECSHSWVLEWLQTPTFGFACFSQWPGLTVKASLVELCSNLYTKLWRGWPPPIIQVVEYALKSQ